jgi:DNA-binding HxlR family transcriptional regulator
LIRDSLKVLGAKWSLLIVRDVVFLGLHRFEEIRRNNAGLTARVLSRRCSSWSRRPAREVGQGGEVTYELTVKGEDAVYILLAVLLYGIRHYMNGADLTEDDAMKSLRYRSPLYRSPLWGPVLISVASSLASMLTL